MIKKKFKINLGKNSLPERKNKVQSKNYFLINVNCIFSDIVILL